MVVGEDITVCLDDDARTQPLLVELGFAAGGAPPSRLLAGDVCRFGSREDLDELTGALPSDLAPARAVGGKTARLHDFGPLIDCRQLERGGALDDQPPIGVERWCRQHVERLGARSLCRTDCGVDLLGF